MNNNPRYDLAIAYRICPHMSRSRPPIHSSSKYELAALCVRSFKRGLANVRAKIWVILDGCPPEYETLFTDLWPAQDLVLVHGQGLCNAGTFKKQIEILTEQTDAEMVYFAEDDYVYRADAFSQMLTFMQSHPDADFCAPYDHPDFYGQAFHQHMTRIKVTGSQAWKTQNGITCSFMTRRTTLVKTRKTFLSYTKITRWNMDAPMWLSLTKHHVFNPIDLITQPFIFPYRGASLVFAWFYNWRQILFGPSYTLWIPVPSLATHMVAGLEAPFINWESEFLINTRAQQAPVSPSIEAR